MATITKTSALKRLGVTLDKLLSVPQVTPMLTEILSGLPQTDPYYYLDSSGDADALKLMHVYRCATPSVRAFLPLEAFCLAAGVDPNSILNSVVASISRVKSLHSSIKLSASQPEIVDVNIEAAKDIDNGHKDRRLFMQVSGLMPMPRGAQTIVNVKTSANASSAPVQQAVIVPAPPPEQTVRRLSERLQAVRGALPAPQEAELVEND